MNLEMLALVRAEEQMHSDTWRRAERGEVQFHAPPPCAVCGTPTVLGRGRRGAVVVCEPCRAKGWRSQLCERCGERPLHHRDYCSSLKKVCGHCRAKVGAERELG